MPRVEERLLGRKNTCNCVNDRRVGNVLKVILGVTGVQLSIGRKSRNSPKSKGGRSCTFTAGIHARATQSPSIELVLNC